MNTSFNHITSHKLNYFYTDSGVTSRVRAASSMLRQHLFRYMGHVSAALILGGVDCCGPQLFTIYPHGSAAEVEFILFKNSLMHFVSFYFFRSFLTVSLFLSLCYHFLILFTHLIFFYLSHFHSFHTVRFYYNGEWLSCCDECIRERISN